MSVFFEKTPKTYKSFVNIISNTRIRPSVDPVEGVPPVPDDVSEVLTFFPDGVPTLQDIGFEESEFPHPPFYGGETEALSRLAK